MVPSTVHFTDLCEVTADVTKVKNLIEPQYNRHGSKYYSLTYDIVLLFGLTELKAQIAWIENVGFTFFHDETSLRLCYRERRNGTLTTNIVNHILMLILGAAVVLHQSFMTRTR